MARRKGLRPATRACPSRSRRDGIQFGGWIKGNESVRGGTREGEDAMTAVKFHRRAVLSIGAAFMVPGAHRIMAGDVDFPARLAEMERDGRVSGLHTLLVSRGGRLLFEHYGTGDDESWGKALGTVTFGPTVLHDLRSVTKSIVGMLYGIALADGKVPPPEAKL